jgi:acyl-CoA dehydrogenase
VDFAHSPKATEYLARVRDFITGEVMPAEQVYGEQLDERHPHECPPIVEELKGKAKAAGLWNLFLPNETEGAGLTNVEYAPLAEAMGWSSLAPESFNCSAPDTGNMELLSLFSTPEQRKRWLEPLLEGEIRSCFAMTEPDSASSDARNVSTRIVRSGDGYVITGRKWFTSGALDPRCRLIVLMGKTDPDAATYRQQSMVLIPMDTPGVTVVRDLKVFGFTDRLGHGEIHFDGVEVPACNLLGQPGEGFAAAQARLGPGRIHHAMRAIGMAERALDLMCRRVLERQAFGGPLADQGVIRDWIARSRIEINQVRLVVLHAAWTMDEYGNAAARDLVGAIKVGALDVAHKVADRAIQAHGAAGVSQDTVLAHMFTETRSLKIADGPDEVHLRNIARRELAKAGGA